MEYSADQIMLKQPFRLICAGASGVGKTWFVKDLINKLDHVVEGDVHSIIYCYSEEQPLYEKIRNEAPNVIWINGFDENLDDYLKDNFQNKILIIDDQMCEGSSSPFLLSLFSKRSHHTNTSVIFITQNLFFQGKYCRTISLNSTCFCVFKNPRDQRQIVSLGMQICPWNVKFLKEIDSDATKLPFSYLFIDLRPDLPEELRFRSNILDPEEQVIYIQKTWPLK